MGRGFETVETGAVAVISNAVWLSEFGGDPSVLGRAIAINGSSFTVVGVAPVELASTRGIFRVDVRLPAAFEQLVRLGEDRQERARHPWVLHSGPTALRRRDWRRTGVRQAN